MSEHNVSIGDKVTTVFDGEVVAIDNELGTVALRGNTRGAQHINWTVDVHWATHFYPQRQTFDETSCKRCGEA